ncbi:MAG: PAS domain S-box protein, partial [Ktedonobacteraceae bacterium]|nr:PAS domain S-box protein [Ktedonobacteraceae bacterium]
LPEARAWREQHCVSAPATQPTLGAAPLMYRQRAIGVLVAIREETTSGQLSIWREEELSALDTIAGAIALLLENVRLQELDRERIHELALLNSISSQVNCSLYDLERLRSVVLQRTREIATVDTCALLQHPSEPTADEWVKPELGELLFNYFQMYKTPIPLVVERPGDNPRAVEVLKLLPGSLKTFFAYPLLRGQVVEAQGSSLLRSGRSGGQERVRKVLGIVVGGYHQAHKLRREELVLLQVLATQAGTVLENIQLVTEVIEARNAARKLLRKVLDDQRFKELILESIPSGLLTTNRKGYVSTFNRAAEAILGYHPDEVKGQSLEKILDLRPLLADNEETISSSKGIHGATITTVDRHGREIILSVDILPLHDNHGRFMGRLTTFTDVTVMRKLEEEKRRLDRLASLGEMAANVAHEVRNPLASIKTSMQLLGDELFNTQPAPEQEDTSAEWARESIAVVLKEVERLDAIVRDLLLFARPYRLHRVRCDLLELSDRVLKLLQSQCLEVGVTVHRLYELLPPLWVDIAQIEQVLLNLYMNALQAMPDGGILTIACRRITTPRDTRTRRTHERSEPASQQETEAQRMTSPLPEAVPSPSPSPPATGWVEISVSDTGMGIAPEHRERIFQPFFTTKAHGIGLGLPITRRLVEDH